MLLFVDDKAVVAIAMKSETEGGDALRYLWCLTEPQ